MPSDPWISINEKPPSANTPVLICAHDGTIDVAILEYVNWDHGPTSASWDVVGVEGYEWEITWKDDRKPWQGVTHWMPCPSLPQKEIPT